MSKHRNPTPTVDCILEVAPGQIVLIQRKNPPEGWALPGGFVDYGEALHVACAREVKEETGLEVTLVEQFFTYSDPSRDPRQHTVTTVFLGTAQGTPAGGDDAAEAKVFPLDALPSPLAFDHGQILEDFRTYRRTGQRRKL